MITKIGIVRKGYAVDIYSEKKSEILKEWIFKNVFSKKINNNYL